MEKRVKHTHIYYGFGFPVKLLNVPMIKVRDVWTPHINCNLLSEVVLRELCEKEGRLTGNEVRFIRQHFEMTLQVFAKRFGVTHPGVLKWESSKNRSTSMGWSTEKDIRLFALTKLTSKPSELAELYEMLAQIMTRGKPIEMKVDAKKLAA